MLYAGRHQMRVKRQPRASLDHGRNFGVPMTGLCTPDRELDPGVVVNACGTTHGSTPICVPDNFDDTDFGGSCDNHDLAYQTCGYPKADADADFLHSLLQACQSSSHPLRCSEIALAYYIAVSTLGGSAYTEAQQSGCAQYPNATCPAAPQSTPGSLPIDYTPDDYTPDN